MPNSAKIMLVIEQINTLFDDFYEKIKNEHHKGKDTVWDIRFRRCYGDYVILHEGYWLDDFWIENKNLLDALIEFRDKIRAKMEKEISEYDFKNHCAKEFSE